MGDLCAGSPPDAASLSDAFGVPVVAVSGLTGEGTVEVDEVQAAATRVHPAGRHRPFKSVIISPSHTLPRVRSA